MHGERRSRIRGAVRPASGLAHSSARSACPRSQLCGLRVGSDRLRTRDHRPAVGSPLTRQGDSGQPLCHPGEESFARASLLAEVVEVQPLDDVRGFWGDADVVVDHELDEVVAVDQDDLLLDSLNVLPGVRGELRSGYQHALSGAEPLEAAGKGLYDRTSHGACPSVWLVRRRCQDPACPP